MWKQIKPFNQSLAGKRVGFCLQNVRKGYGIAAEYVIAIEAWDAVVAAKQGHKDRSIPAGDVPLFYTYKTDGHVNVRLANGKVWSDGTIYLNLDDYLAKHTSVHYLGWGESLNGVRVLQSVPDPKHMETVRKGTWNVRSTNSTSGSILGHVLGGQRFETVIVGSNWRKITFNGKTGYVGPAAW